MTFEVAAGVQGQLLGWNVLTYYNIVELFCYLLAGVDVNRSDNRSMCSDTTMNSEFCDKITMIVHDSSIDLNSHLRHTCLVVSFSL